MLLTKLTYDRKRDKNVSTQILGPDTFIQDCLTLYFYNIHYQYERCYAVYVKHNVILYFYMIYINASIFKFNLKSMPIVVTTVQ